MSDEMQLLIDLHKHNERQGPGGRVETELAMYLAGLDFDAKYEIADIGCGTGASSLVLADMLDANVTAVDFLPDFLDVLSQRAQEAELDAQIQTLCASMEDLPFSEGQFDVLWSEGAIYNMGFATGVRSWKPFLKKGGVLVVSEITWTTGTRPQKLEDYWQAHYREIDTASNKLSVLEQAGYKPLGYFILPIQCWLDNYYGPLQSTLEAFLDRYGHSDLARQIIKAEQEEMAMYDEYKDYYSYGFYIAEKL